MKKIKKAINLILLFVIFTSTLNAQYVADEMEENNDSIECLQNISLYREFLKQKIMERAIDGWKKTYVSCKGFKKTIYLDGVKLLDYSIINEKDKAKRGILIDSLIKIYEERIKYFNQEGFVRGKQGLDLLKYDNTRIQEAHPYLEKSLELEKNNTEAAVIAMYMSTSSILYKQGKLSKDELINNYLKCVDILDKKIKQEKKTDELKNLKIALDAVDKAFATCTFDCKSLVNAFSSVFEEKKDDIEQLIKIQNLLKGSGCIDEELYFNVSLKIQEIDPSAENAQLLAALYLKKENYTKAIDYLNEAIKLEKTDSLKASYYHDIGFIYCHKLKQYHQARANAYDAIKYRPNWGNPYILIGDAYAASSASFGGDPFTNATVFWTAVDKYYKAKSVDTEVEQLANQKIAYYSNYFPKNEDVFMQGLAEGNSYKVGGWINETTTVRVKK